MYSYLSPKFYLKRSSYLSLKKKSLFTSKKKVVLITKKDQVISLTSPKVQINLFYTTSIWL